MTESVHLLDDSSPVFQTSVPSNVQLNATQPQKQNQVEALPQNFQKRKHQKSPNKRSKCLTKSNKNDPTCSLRQSVPEESPETSSTSESNSNPIFTVLPILVDEERSIVAELRSLDQNRSELVDQLSKIVDQLREIDYKRTPFMQRLDHLRELKQEVIMGQQNYLN